MMELDTIRVLLVEDDEDDYFLVKELLKEIKDRNYELEWQKTYETGLATMLRNNHHICLIDYRLGAHNGLELLKAALAGGCISPVILLTGMGQHEVDVAAMKAGAADYLVKGQLDVNQLERSIRHAIERKRAAAQAAFEQARLAGFGAQVGLALTQRASLPVTLENCAEAMVQYLNGALTQIWVCDPVQTTLELRACAGPLFKAVGSPLLLPMLTLNMEEIALGKPVLIKSLAGDTRLKDQS